MSMTTVALCVAAVAVFWGGWPLVARAAGEMGVMGALVMSVAMLLTVAPFALAASALPPMRAVVILTIAGAMMGLGLIAFNAVTTTPAVEVSTIVPITDTAMLLVALVGGVWFFGEPLTARKLVGMTLLLAGIAVLRPRG